MSECRKKTTPNRRPARGRMLSPFRLEHLEDRLVPTVYVVNDPGSDFFPNGKITLAEAIRAAVTNDSTLGGDAPAGSATARDEITFAAGLDDINLSFALDEIGPASGPLSILGPTTETMMLLGQSKVAEGFVVNGQ